MDASMIENKFQTMLTVSTLRLEVNENKYKAENEWPLFEGLRLLLEGISLITHFSIRRTQEGSRGTEHSKKKTAIIKKIVKEYHANNTVCL
jgi:hypothetical protein